jgi:hypothetical protein
VILIGFPSNQCKAKKEKDHVITIYERVSSLIINGSRKRIENYAHAITP